MADKGFNLSIGSMLGLRGDGRADDALRTVRISRRYIKYAEGSVLYEAGDTRVVCTASIEDKLPAWRRGTKEGWITAEYGMLPRATETRNQRESSKGRPSARSQEIQRLIGRSLRAAVDLSLIGERTIWIDCDVIQADGGTRTASITGSFVALVDALRSLLKRGGIEKFPFKRQIAAVSVGMVGGKCLLDLTYEEDSSASVDMNIVMTDHGEFVEIQGTGEEAVFSRKEMDRLIEMAGAGVKELFKHQYQALAFTKEELDAIKNNSGDKK